MPSLKSSIPTPSPIVAWLGIGVWIFLCLSLLANLSDRFGYDVDVIDMPVPALVGLMMAAGLVFLCLPRLVTAWAAGPEGHRVYLLAWIVIAGVAMRLAFFGTQPILEDDYNRYLLDGAVTAHGYNPYSRSPDEIASATSGDPGLQHIARDAGVVMERINYPLIRTVYPPVAQIAFAMAHWLKPWSLDAWRLVILACDLAVLGLIILLLREVGRTTAWIALYWWNPVVVKELYSSTHMDVLVALAVLTALWFAVRRRPLASGVAVAVGIATKLWPVLLIPTLLRNWVSVPRILLPALAVIAALSAAFLSPVVLSGLNESSGFVAYGSRWQANDALFRIVLWVCLQVSDILALSPAMGKLMARAVVGLVLCAIVVAINRQPSGSPRDTCRRVFITVGALLLLSPTQFPWYYAWLAVLLPLFPARGFLVLSVTLPLYYSFFYLIARDQEWLFETAVVFLIWLPAWALLLADRLQRGTAPEPEECDRLPGEPANGGSK